MHRRIGLAVSVTLDLTLSRCELPTHQIPRWEDGLLQLDVPKRYMRQFVAQDDASAGKGIPLTVDVVEHLTWIGKTVGPVLDEVRKSIHLTALTKVRAIKRAQRKIGVYILFVTSGAINVDTVAVGSHSRSFVAAHMHLRKVVCSVEILGNCFVPSLFSLTLTRHSNRDARG